ncbi:MAG TPA: polyamine ABC transporter substrate-binding protein [Caulobacteraceae bacterium]|nr:polyamine ABC transporter substrate-binding protein [Caulobacteraceae bacterium]
MRSIKLTVLLAALALAACGEKASSGAQAAQTLHLYNWADYIDPQILKDFTTETHIKVVYDTYDSNEVLETKVLTGGTGYDLVVPSNHNVPRYIAAGAIQPLDQARIPNARTLWPQVMAFLEPFDPGRKYTVPYMWGTIGIGYNKAAIEKRLPGVKIDSWAFAFDPANLAKLQDCGVYWLDASEDMYSVALRAMGRDPNSKNLADYQAATAMMLKGRPYVRKFDSSGYLDRLAAGDICLAVAYSGDVMQAQARAREAGGKVDLAYAVPKEGSQVWFDVFAMPKDAPDPSAAYAFLDYIERPAVIAKASNFIHYANANQASQPLLDPAVRDDPNVYPPAQVMGRLFVITAKDQPLLREINRDWTRVKSGR